MRIGFDVSQTAEDKAGCGFFADQLIRSLAKLDHTNEYLLYPTFYNYRYPLFYRTTKPHAKNFRRHFGFLSLRKMFAGWDKKMEDRSEWLGSPDIVHSNNFSCVKDHRARIVYTLYDVVPLAHPEFMAEATRLVCTEGLFNASRYADHCVAISEHTKRSFLSFFPHYPEERITVVPLGTRDGISRLSDQKHIRKVLEKFGLRGDFWLGVGTIEPRKNYRLVIEAYSMLKGPRPLVIAGGKGWLESGLGKKVADLGMQDRVKILGYVTDDELSVLYSACFAFVYPSYYEGFGLPVLEAMHCGAAVITSDSSSLPEVAGNAALYVDPLSKESLVEKMDLLASNEVLLKELRCRAIERSKIYSWEETGKRVLDVYEGVVKSRPLMEKEIA